MDYPLPVIKRAREYRLYDEKGRRYLDFYQESGKALLGHRQNRLSLELKNTISRGLMSAYPSIYHRRLEKALRKIIPGYNGIHVCQDLQTALGRVSRITGKPVTPETVKDPLFGNPEGISLWRPFLQTEYPDIVFPVIPLPGSFALSVFGVKQERKEYTCSGISALTATAAARAAYNLHAFINENPYSDCSLQLKDWDRTGPYLIFKGDENRYKEIYKAGIKTGVLLSPGYPSFCIIPAVYEEGEMRAFLRETEND